MLCSQAIVTRLRFGNDRGIPRSVANGLLELLQQHGGQVAALERQIGNQALELGG